VPLSILVDDKGIVRDLIPGWSVETQRKLSLLMEAKAEAAVRSGTK
jgi:hypothetical protein